MHEKLYQKRQLIIINCIKIKLLIDKKSLKRVMYRARVKKVILERETFISKPQYIDIFNVLLFITMRRKYFLGTSVELFSLL